MNGEPYSSDYYERGVELGISGYSHYRWLPDATIPLAYSIVSQLGIHSSERILDWGCAKGYLVWALRLLHFQAWGADISEYAISSAPEEVRPYLKRGGSLDATRAFGSRFDWLIAKDALEHVAYSDLARILSELRAAARNLFVVVPLGRDGRYVIPEYEYDITHVIREDLGWWRQRFEDAGFLVHIATYKMPHIKENWQHYPRGNGFFVLRAEP